MQKGRIMIVETEAIVALELQSRLRRLGFDVIGSCDASQAASCASMLAPDLALVGVSLLDATDGLQAAEDVRRTSGVPVVFLTHDDESLSRVQSIAPLGCLRRPFEERALAATIETALLRHRAEAARLDAERARRRAEARYSAMLESSPDAIVSVDREQRIVVFNGAAERMFGWRSDEIVGRPLEVLLPRESRDAHRMHLDAFRVTGGTTRGMGAPGKIFGLRRTGERFPVEIAISMHVREEETLLIAVVRDVSEQTVLAEQLRRAQQLEAVGMLASSVVHDVNNLLAVIQHATELIRRDPPRERSRELASTIMGAVSRGAALTRQLLLHARKDTVERDVVGVDEVLSQMAVLVEHLAGETIRVRWSLRAPGTRVNVDRQRLEQIVLNCVANARDAMPRGGTIEIDTRPLSAGWVELAVRDTGNGIPLELRTRIFEPFFTTKSEGQGSGLGLWTVREVVRESGGELEVESELGRGTRFVFRLPTTESSASPEPPVSEERTDTRVQGSIMVVDDEQPLRDLLARTLVGAGFEVHVAACAGEALAFLAREREAVDVLVTDFAMPIMTGPELAERMRRFVPRLRVVYMSGYADELRDRIRLLGRDDVLLAKPFTGDDLVSRIRRVMLGG